MNVEGVNLFCFGASYAVALVCEIMSTRWRWKLLRPAILAFGIAGVVAHSIFLSFRALGAEIAPLESSFDSLMVLSWVLSVIYISIRWYYPKAQIGIFALPLIFGLVFFGSFLEPDSAGGSRVIGIWGIIHGVLLVAGAIAVTISFLAGVMYLVQARRLKSKKRPMGHGYLPSLEYLERLNNQGITFSFSLLTVSLGIGVLLAVHQLRSGNVEIQLLDPKVISAAGVWLLFGFLLQARAWPMLRGRRVALLTIVGFGLLLFTIVGVDLLYDTWHQGGGGAS